MAITTSTTIDELLLGVMNYLINPFGSNPTLYQPSQVFLTLFDEPAQIPGAPCVAIRVGNFRTDSRQAEGAGIGVVGATGICRVILIYRALSDIASQATVQLTNQASNAYIDVNNILNILHMQMLYNQNGDGILEEPMRFLDVTEPRQFIYLQDYSHIDIIFEMKAALNLQYRTLS